MKTILVTGGAGFMGSNFIRYMLGRHPDYKILILDALTYAGSMDSVPRDPQVQFWFGNVRNAELVNTLVAQSDIVVHFAAETHVTRSIFDNLLFFETDVLGTQAVANAVLKNNSVERFIHISTSEVYGTARTEIMDEEHPLMPSSPYASAKAGADRLVYSYWYTYDVPAVILRPFNNYGPFQHLEKVIPRFITSCILNEPLTVHGDGKARRDWLFIEDLCEALDKVIHCDIGKIKGEVINIGTGRSIDVQTIAEIVVDMMDKPRSLITRVGDRPGQVFRHASSIDKIKRLCGWKPRVSFEEGLVKTKNWYEQNRWWWEKLLWMRSVPIITKDGKTESH
jgi:dTDP-glucose 4,6-dehydratase